MNNFKQHLKAEGEKLKNMSFGEKVSYIIEYYKLYFLTIALIAFVVISLVVSIKQNNFNTYLSIYLIDNPISNEYEDYILKDYATHCGIDGVNDKIVLDSTLTLEIEQYGEYDTQSLYKLMALIGSETVDTIISTKDITSFCAASEIYYDLNELLDESFLSKYSDLLYYVTLEDGSQIAAGIDISGLDIVERCNIILDDPVICVAANTTRKDVCIDFIKYIFNE